MEMFISKIGEVGAFIFNLIILYLLIKKNKGILKYNKNRPYRLQEKSIKIFGLSIYFGGWIVASLVSWYFLEMIRLGEFFAFGVVIPCLIILFLEWIEVI